MGKPTIRETIVSQSKAGMAVQLHISDVPKDSEDATFRLVLLATLPHYETPLLLILQREALLRGRQLLGELAEECLQKIRHSGYPAEPREDA